MTELFQPFRHSPGDTVVMVTGACPKGRVGSGLTDWLTVRSDGRKVSVAVEEEGNQRMDRGLQRKECSNLNVHFLKFG